ncbi:unannotated protein [freshwater metagenome]|uniref:Unannotated protein n=1 Tax=freshwater metagenome TaxID=449393 RepID=A0A6J7J347_9ZZZZ|nr:hypothetical protein [Actinomycetota bacterium]
MLRRATTLCTLALGIAAVAPAGAWAASVNGAASPETGAGAVQPKTPTAKRNAGAKKKVAKQKVARPKVVKPVAPPVKRSVIAQGQGVVGGQAFGEENLATTPTVPGDVAVLLPTGLAAAPENAPIEVQRAIWAANRIVGKPYIYGGGHRRFEDRGYDCSGTVSYALHGGDLIDTPMDSSDYMRWGLRGRGAWITVYTNPGHAFVVIAGLRLDTSAAGDPEGGKGPRWRPTLRSTSGYRARHLGNL